MLQRMSDAITGIKKEYQCIIHDQYIIHDSKKTRDKEIEAYYNAIAEEERFFSNIVGYTDIKKLFYRALNSKHSVSYCLIGPPASAKSVFLQEIERQKKNESAFVDGTGASGRGLVEALLAKPHTKYLLIDEIDKMKKVQVTVLYNVLETGRLTSTKKNFTFDQMFEGLRVFATSNSRERMPRPLISRISTLLVSEYTFAEFQEISRRLLRKRFGLSNQVADMISSGVWNKIGTKDIRKVLTIAKLVNIKDTQQDIDWLIDVHAKHSTVEAE